MTDRQPELSPVQVPIVWVGLEESDVLFVNQFLAQVEPGSIYLSIGQLTPPVLVGTEEEQRAQAAQLRYVPVRPAGRFALTRKAATELADVLQQSIANYDRVEDASRGGGER